MKNIKRITAIMTFIILTTLVLVSPQAIAQTAPPPNNGTTGSGGNTPVGGGAPIADGVIMILSASIFYGLYKYKFGNTEASELKI